MAPSGTTAALVNPARSATAPRVHRRSAAPLAALLLSTLVAGCNRDEQALASERSSSPFRLELPGLSRLFPATATEVAVPGDLPAFVVRGADGGCPRMVFLSGMCSHGLGYIQSFQAAARDHGGVLALQGDTACSADGAFRKYSFDLDKQDARIQAALATCGGKAEDLVLAGYSQGAYVAERLAERWPERYTRLVLIGAPTTPSAARLRKLRGAVLVSGEHDAKYRMKDGTKALEAAKVPAMYLEMPGAGHGQMTEAERTMDEALTWLDEHARAAP
ncbi:alpha/beta hydrolase [Chondromyces crocatus]|uniref:Serine aminopeptidase S33 domain-containing protein n=1 Tax=Chondromyces crocatus TaxID=52 RepID=A0A0K1EA75_CHOCO|nr:alpha/beta hydrolase [Chondromyces crocatus]AKT37562.1 uncharacterized protein CMC5_017030 [Chondromyces crocatus]